MSPWGMWWLWWLRGGLCLVLIQEVSLQEEHYGEKEFEYEEPQPLNCSTSEVIRGGEVTFSQGGVAGSALTYHCGAGLYPHPVSHRVCDADGEWSTMRQANGRRVSQAVCKEVLCAGQIQLGHGELCPRVSWFRPGERQNFTCQEGFTLFGSPSRKCSLSGEWTGSTPVCRQQSDDGCNDPGVPPGGLRSTSRFRTEETVQYRCQSGTVLLGPEERVCLENREWSGSEPRCQAPYAFDSPSVVAEAMGGSLAGVMDVLSPEFKKKVTFGRMLRVTEAGMHVFILLDTSGSITPEHFQHALNATAALIRKLDSYDVDIRYQVTSYASRAIDIVQITDYSLSAERVIARLNSFNYKSHGRETGTNLYAALEKLNSKMADLKARVNGRNRFNQTQNVIIIETDGFSNTGGNPLTALARIRSMLGYPPTSKDHTEERLLDVYVFGIGNVVNMAELNSIASNKRNEQHLFILQDYQMLGEVFNNIISDKSVTMCGIAQEEVPEQANRRIKTPYTSPWHVTVSEKVTQSQNCQGSLVSLNWVLTAAHCFSSLTMNPNTVTIKHGEGMAQAKRVVLHPLYNIRRLASRNVSEFYDYDVALVQLETSVPLSSRARPLCLPCTMASNRALKMSPNSTTCEQHMKELLPDLQGETSAYFISKKDSKRKQTHILTGSQRTGCVQQAQRVLKPPTDVSLEEYVTDRFLCSGGSAGHIDAVSCKGDSGGSLFLQKRMRYFQVGIVSWGTVDLCRKPDGKHTSLLSPSDARDFHINVFSVMPWLREHLVGEMHFLPD